MNWADILILIFLLFFFLLGFARGLIRQVFSLAAVTVGIVSGVLFYDSVGRMLIEKNVIESGSSALLAGFIVVAVVVFIIIQIFGWLAAKVIGKLHLGWLNRLAGGVVGIAIGTLIMFFFISWLNISTKSTFKNSKLFPHIKTVHDKTMDSIPDDFKKGYEQIKEQFVKEGKKAIIHIKESDKNPDRSRNKGTKELTDQ